MLGTVTWDQLTSVGNTNVFPRKVLKKSPKGGITKLLLSVADAQLSNVFL